MTLLVLPQMSNAKLSREPSSNMASPVMHKLLLRNPRALSLGHEEKQGGNRETSLPAGYKCRVSEDGERLLFVTRARHTCTLMQDVDDLLCQV